MTISTVSWCVFIAMLISSIAAVVNGDGDELPMITKLRDDLFVKQKYNADARPVRNHKNCTQVVFFLSIRMFLDVVSSDIITILLIV